MDIRQMIRDLAFALLNDNNGINELAFERLTELLLVFDSKDITQRIDATDGRFYLPNDK